MLLFPRFALLKALLLATLPSSGSQFSGGGGHRGGSNHNGGGWGGDGWGFRGAGHRGGGLGHHPGYGYGSDICYGARGGQPQQQQYQYPAAQNQYPQYGGFNSYQQEPTPIQPTRNYQQYQHQPAPVNYQTMQPTRVQPQPVINYLTSLPTTCSNPDSRDAGIFEQKCIFPNEYSQVGCTSRGSSIPVGTSAILTCKSPQYYSSNGDILVAICKDGAWQGDSKSLTCKLTAPATQPPPVKAVQQYQPTEQSKPLDYVVDYVRKPVYENPQPQYIEYAPTTPPQRWAPAPQTTPPPVYVYPPTSTTTTTMTTTTTTPKPTTTSTTTTAKPYIDWRNSENMTNYQYPDNSYNRSSNPLVDSRGTLCPPLTVKPGVILECLSKKQRRSGSGYLVSVSDCQEPQIQDTEATYKCQMYYEPWSGATTQYRKCKERGNWSGSDDGFLCTLECGKQNPTGRLPLITFGEVTVLGAFPWHAALFIKDRDPKFTNACGGTLITFKKYY